MKFLLQSQEFRQLLRKKRPHRVALLASGLQHPFICGENEAAITAEFTFYGYKYTVHASSAWITSRSKETIKFIWAYDTKDLCQTRQWDLSGVHKLQINTLLTTVTLAYKSMLHHNVLHNKVWHLSHSEFIHLLSFTEIFLPLKLVQLIYRKMCLNMYMLRSKAILKIAPSFPSLSGESLHHILKFLKRSHNILTTELIWRCELYRRHSIISSSHWGVSFSSWPSAKSPHCNIDVPVQS